MTEIALVDRFDLRFETRRWQFADDNRTAIDARFAAKQNANPALWNGRVLLAHQYGVADGVCRGAFLETDFASFNAWRDWGRPHAGIVTGHDRADRHITPRLGVEQVDLLSAGEIGLDHGRLEVVAVVVIEPDEVGLRGRLTCDESGKKGDADRPAFRVRRG